jgi:hypothetical protein
MVKEKSKIQTILESVFINAADKLIKAEGERFVSDLYVQLDTASGEVQVYDDQETLLEKNVIFDWVDHSEKTADSYRQPIGVIRGVLAGLKAGKIFDNPVFMHPFNVSLVDDGFCEIEVIFTTEGDESFMEGRLMKNLEQELQNFSENLFADIE